MKRSPAISVISIAGLALGMAVAMVITLWIREELAWNKSFPNYKTISQVMITGTFSGETSTDPTCSPPMADLLRKEYASDFERVVLTTKPESHILGAGNEKLSALGSFAEEGFSEIFSLTPVSGSFKSSGDPHTIFLSRSLALSLFGSTDVIGETVKFDTRDQLKVVAVYEDLPRNFTYSDIGYVLPWNYYTSLFPGLEDRWNQCRYLIFVQLHKGVDCYTASTRIAGFMKPHLTDIDPVVSLHPMSKWYLYEAFKNGKNIGGRVQYLWMFGLVGFFVLLLACINFMNLSTAKSEKRARDVGVLKAIGSERMQLAIYFMVESAFTVFIAFGLALALVWLGLPWLNSFAHSDMSIPFDRIYFWLAILLLITATSFLAGSYPAFYLSSFRPVKVLKGSFTTGKSVGVLRKSLVVVQFFASIFLIVGTLVVLQQLDYVKNRPVGYDDGNLITIPVDHFDVQRHFAAIRNELVSTGAAAEVALSSAPVNRLNLSLGGYTWDGMEAREGAIFGSISINEDFAPAVQWKFREGRNFSRSFPSDSLTVIINETAARYMGMMEAVGRYIGFHDERYRIVGVIEDAVMGSPFESIAPAAFFLGKWMPMNTLTVSLSPNRSVAESLEKIKSVMTKFNSEARLTMRSSTSSRHSISVP